MATMPESGTPLPPHSNRCPVHVAQRGTRSLPTDVLLLDRKVPGLFLVYYRVFLDGCPHCHRFPGTASASPRARCAAARGKWSRTVNVVSSQTVSRVFPLHSSSRGSDRWLARTPTVPLCDPCVHNSPRKTHKKKGGTHQFLGKLCHTARRAKAMVRSTARAGVLSNCRSSGRSA